MNAIERVLHEQDVIRKTLSIERKKLRKISWRENYKAYYEKHKDYLNAKRRELYHSDKERFRQYYINWKNNDPERARRVRKKSYLKYRAKIKQQKKETQENVSK